WNYLPAPVVLAGWAPPGTRVQGQPSRCAKHKQSRHSLRPFYYGRYGSSPDEPRPVIAAEWPGGLDPGRDGSVRTESLRCLCLVLALFLPWLLSYGCPVTRRLDVRR